MNNPVVTGIAAGVGVFLASLFVTGTDLGSALIAGVVTGAVGVGLLWYIARRRGT